MVLQSSLAGSGRENEMQDTMDNKNGRCNAEKRETERKEYCKMGKKMDTILNLFLFIIHLKRRISLETVLLNLIIEGRISAHDFKHLKL
ncbi:hypothetical protein POVCU2_0027290 [Plasmodium ovale curtisi]|uniref:Uncharacterized protein n=1 Tax=Plasmodium ovale curtisi TaxID=864141 RepID=A0A1A8VVS1_PLAOA|nr:hypothetical protein POVCU2_0027290 [Plasmodium ovale curtisi]SBS93250.1 hypothetical protein POVCU1_025030 [Plasmodium ovale curtisi]